MSASMYERMSGPLRVRIEHTKYRIEGEWVGLRRFYFHVYSEPRVVFQLEYFPYEMPDTPRYSIRINVDNEYRALQIVAWILDAEQKGRSE